MGGFCNRRLHDRLLLFIRPPKLVGRVGGQSALFALFLFLRPVIRIFLLGLVPAIAVPPDGGPSTY